MSITSIDISALYITMFNRVPEGAGHKFWFNLAKKQGLNTSQVAQQMLNLINEMDLKQISSKLAKQIDNDGARKIADEILKNI